jgi:hypothetical protein
MDRRQPQKVDRWDSRPRLEPTTAHSVDRFCFDHPDPFLKIIEKSFPITCNALKSKMKSK